MSKKLLSLFLVILLAGVLIAWYVNGYISQFLPPELSNPFVLTLSVLGFISAVQGAIAAVQRLGELFFPPKPAPSSLELLRLELRSLRGPISREEAQEYTEKILGKQSAEFWAQMGDGLSPIHELARDPVWLDGLMDVFRNKAGKLPANPGTYLNDLLKVIWTPEKLGSKDFVALEVAEIVLARANEYRHIVYMRNEAASGQSVDKASYEGFVRLLGARSLFWLRLQQRVLQVLDHQMEKSEATRVIVDFLLSPEFRLHLSFVRLPVAWRMVFYLPYLLARFMILLLKTVLKIVSFSYFVTAIQKKRGQVLLEKFEKIHILMRDGYHVQFSNPFWEKYFRAVAYQKSIENLEQLKFNDDDPYWNRPDLREEDVITILYGLAADKSKFLQDIFTLNPYLAGICLVETDESDTKLLREKTVQWLLEQLRLDACLETPRSLVLSTLLVKLHHSPALLIEIFSIINKEWLGRSLVGFSRLIAGLGAPAAKVIRGRWETELSHEVRQTIILALGEMQNETAASFLREIMQTAQYEIKYYAAVMLTLNYAESQAAEFLQAALQTQKGSDERQWAWHALPLAGAKAFPLAIVALKSLRKRYRFGNPDLPWNRWEPARDVFIEFAGKFTESLLAEEFVLKLLDEHDRDLKLLALEVSASFKGARITLKLLELLHSRNDEDIQAGVLEALGGRSDDLVIQAVIGELYNDDPGMVVKALSALKKASHPTSIQPLIEKLNDERLVEGRPIAFLALEALSSLVFLTACSSLQRKTIKLWCQNHLDDSRAAYFFEQLGDS